MEFSFKTFSVCEDCPHSNPQHTVLGSVFCFGKRFSGCIIKRAVPQTQQSGCRRRCSALPWLLRQKMKQMATEQTERSLLPAAFLSPAPSPSFSPHSASPMVLFIPPFFPSLSASLTFSLVSFPKVSWSHHFSPLPQQESTRLFHLYWLFVNFPCDPSALGTLAFQSVQLQHTLSAIHLYHT